MIPASTLGSMPSAAPKFIASLTPIIEMPSSRLLQIFAIWPVPDAAAVDDVLAHARRAPA